MGFVCEGFIKDIVGNVGPVMIGLYIKDALERSHLLSLGFS